MVSEAQPQSPTPEELESTAELPMLDLEAYEAELEAQRGVGEDDAGPTLIQPRLSDTAISADFANFEAEIAALGADVERLRTLLLERDAAVAESRQRMSAAEAASAAAVARLAAAEAEIGVAREERESFWQRNETLDAELRAAQALIEELNTAATTQAARLAELEQRLQAAERTAAWASADSSGARGQVAALQEALRSREARRGLWETIWREADAEIAATSASSGRLSGELEQAMARIAVLERELAESRSATEAARSELASVSGERDQVSQRLTSSETALGARSGELDVQRQRGDALTAQLESATREAATLRDELAEARRTLQAELDALRAAQAQAATAAAEREQQLRRELEQQAAAAAAAQTQLRDALQVAEARAHHLEVELSLKNARLEARRAFEARREEVSMPAADAVAARPAAPAAHPPAAAPSAPGTPVEIAASAAADATAGSGAFPAPAELAVDAPVDAPSAVVPPRTADVLPLDLPGSPQRVARREPELLPEGAPRYLILSEGNAETVFRLGRRTTIGRADDNDIAITRASISRHHAVIVSGPRQSVIEDLNSTNGVLVNRQRVRETVLRDGDVVHIGKCRFRFTSRLRSSGKT
jgi:hypothetical protein